MNNTSHKLNLAIIGAGKVGQSLARLFSLTGYSVTVIGRDLRLEIDKYQQCISNADVVLITTSDGEIKTACENITPFLTDNTVITHCSGALDSSVLESAKTKGCYVASSHPLNTFPTLSASLATLQDTDHGTALFCEGESAALSVLSPLFETAGFNIVEIASDAKTAYHTACVFACNYLTVLMDLSLTTAAHGGIDKTQFWQAIQPLVQATLTNITQQGITDSLSGPIARGDTQTVTQHIDFLSTNNKPIGDTYLSLAEHTLRLAKQQGDLSDEKLEQLKAVLDR